MKWVKLFDSWKRNYKLELLIEAVVNLDQNIQTALEDYQSSDNDLFKSIAKTLVGAIGTDFEKNTFKEVLVEPDTISNKQFKVKTEKQTNLLSVTKTIRTLLVAIGANFKDHEIQMFCDNLIGKLKGTEGEFKVIDGKDITFFYNSKNTNIVSGSELANSCMSGTSKAGFMKFYEENSDKVKLVVKLSGGKLDARALLWKLDFSEAGYEYFLDRCYCNDNSDIETLFKFATEKFGKVNRRETNFGDVKDVMVVKLKQCFPDAQTTKQQYPWLDTMKYLHIKKQNGKLENVGILSNVADPMSGVGKPEGRLTSVLKNSPNWNKDYWWLASQDTHALFTLQSTIGVRKPHYPEDSEFENEPQFLVIAGVGWNYITTGPFQDYRNVLELLKIRRRTGNIENCVKFETPDKEPQGMVRIGNYFLPPEYILKDIDGDPVPSFSSVGLADVSKLYLDDIKIKLGEKEVSFRKIYDFLTQGNIYLCRDPKDPDFKRYLATLDCEILGIPYEESNRVEFSQWCSGKYRKQTEYLKRLVTDPEKQKLIQLREDLTHDVVDFDFEKLEFKKFKRSL